MRTMLLLRLSIATVASALAVPAMAQTPAPAPAQPATAAPAATAPVSPVNPSPGAPAKAVPSVPAGATLPADYVIGPEDVLSVVFWREKDMSADVVVRPDGKISLPLLNDVPAAGLTPEQLRLQLIESAARLIEEPTVAVVVKTINSRKVFVTGQVSKPGPYPLYSPTTVLQALATAGGLLEYAESKEIRVMRTESGKPVSFKFNYKDVIKGKNLKQNIELRPGDTIIVP